MSEATFEAATVEAALAQAATEMGTDTDRIDYEVVEEKQDFWGVGDGSVVIRAWVNEGAADAPEEAEEDGAGEAAAEEAGPEEAAATEAAPEEAGAAEAGGEEEAAPADAGAEDESAPGDVAASEAPTSGDRGGFWDTEPAATDAAGEAPPQRDEAPPGATAQDEAPAQERMTPPEAAAGPDEGQPEVPRDEAPSDAAAATTAASESDEGDADPEAITALLEQVFHDMAFECTVSIEKQEGGFLASVNGADKELLLEGNGRCLSALELILNNSFRHKLPRGRKIRVDAGDFRSRREEELSDLAFQVAHSAKEAGRTQETQPLNPYERRLVHLALADDASVTTRSRGSGFLKNVQVIPRSSGGSPRRRGR